MKSLKQFITEAVDITKVTNLTIVYKTIPEDIIVKVPSNYGESDMQIYLDDKLLNELPGASKASKTLLGDNIEDISDAYFQYEKFSASDELSGDVNLDWDPKYDDNAEGDTYTYYTLKGFKYNINFEEFNLSNVNDSDIKEQLTEIFESLNSNKTNVYPIDIELDSVSYNEQED